MFQAFQSSTKKLNSLNTDRKGIKYTHSTAHDGAAQVFRTNRGSANEIALGKTGANKHLTRLEGNIYI